MNCSRNGFAIRVFLSTLSLRRATYQGQAGFAGYRNFYPRSPCGERLIVKMGIQVFNTDFYPRSPCGERPDDLGARLGNYCISIHALLAESDLVGDVWACRWPDISIHALLAESDSDRLQFIRYIIKFLSTLSLRRATYQGQAGFAVYRNFYPRSPCGERQQTA